MVSKEVLLTHEGLKKLEEELEILKTIKRKEIAARIKTAKEFGDISENSEYEEAKNEQAFVEGRIATLEKMLRNARIINELEITTDEVSVGCSVKLLDVEINDEFTYAIVGSAEADPSQYKISNESPVGKALLGKKAGEVVEINVPAGILKYKVLEINK
jgi:transcription elongation factor GreA